MEDCSSGDAFAFLSVPSSSRLGNQYSKLYPNRGFMLGLIWGSEGHVSPLLPGDTVDRCFLDWI